MTITVTGIDMTDIRHQVHIRERSRYIDIRVNKIFDDYRESGRTFIVDVAGEPMPIECTNVSDLLSYIEPFLTKAKNAKRT